MANEELLGMDQPVEQPQPEQGGMLQTLMSALGPSSAEAASPYDYQQRAILQQQQQQAQRRRLVLQLLLQKRMREAAARQQMQRAMLSQQGASTRQQAGFQQQNQLQQQRQQFEEGMLQKRSTQRQQEKETAPLADKSANYINVDTGEYAKPDTTVGEVTKQGTKFQAMDANKKRIFDNLNTLKAHIGLSEQYLNEFPKETPNIPGGRTWNQFKMWLRTKSNDPAAVALSDQLENMTAGAMARNFAARGGPTFAKMLVGAAFTGGEDQNTAKEKLKNLKTLTNEIAQYNGLPTKLFPRGEGAAPAGQPSGQPAAAAPAAPAAKPAPLAGGWQELPGGIKIRPKQQKAK